MVVIVPLQPGHAIVLAGHAIVFATLLPVARSITRQPTWSSTRSSSLRGGETTFLFEAFSPSARSGTLWAGALVVASLIGFRSLRCVAPKSFQHDSHDHPLAALNEMSTPPDVAIRATLAWFRQEFKSF
jgi:hypothetical protein